MSKPNTPAFLAKTSTKENKSPKMTVVSKPKGAGLKTKGSSSAMC